MNDNLFRPLPSPTHEQPATLAESALLAAATILDVGRQTGVLLAHRRALGTERSGSPEPAVHVSILGPSLGGKRCVVSSTTTRRPSFGAHGTRPAVRRMKRFRDPETGAIWVRPLVTARLDQGVAAEELGDRGVLEDGVDGVGDDLGH